MADNEIYELTHTVEDNNEDNFEFDATEAASDLVVVSPATFNLSHEQSNNTDEFAFSDGDEDVEPMNLAPATFNMTHTRTGDTDSFDFDDEGGSTPTGDLSGGTVDFVEAATRTNIESGSTLSTLFSRIKKWFSDLKTVAFTGSYSDLINKPSIPAAQIQSDWSQSDNTQVDYIKNKPTIPAAQVNSDWNASSGVAEILHKPTIPTVNNPTITFTQGGVTKGSISLNQAGDETIALDAGGSGGDVPDVTGSATVDGNVGTPGVTVTTTGSGTQADPYNLAFAFTNLKGAQGNPGQNGSDGHDGSPGADGSSAYCSVSKVGDTATITCTDKNGTTTATVTDGSDGSPGATGATGPAGPGVAPAGTTGQYLRKKSNADYDTEWVNGGSGSNHNVYHWKANSQAYARGSAFTDIPTDLVYGVDIPNTETIIGCAPKYCGLPQICCTNIWVNSSDGNRIYYTVWNFGASANIDYTVAEGAIITIPTT